jgi:hypothetical protein
MSLPRLHIVRLATSPSSGKLKIGWSEFDELAQSYGLGSWRQLGEDAWDWAPSGPLGRKAWFEYNADDGSVSTKDLSKRVLGLLLRLADELAAVVRDDKGRVLKNVSDWP